MRGSQIPRLWTPPLRDLTRVESSYGYDLIDFADEIGWPFDPWQKWLAIHIGELLPDGRPRFRIALIVIPRQNGKTLFSRVLTLYWMFLERVPLVIGTSADRDKAKETWRELVQMARKNDVLADELDKVHTRNGTGEEAFFNKHGSMYRFFAPNSKAGRSFTVHRLVMDELLEQKNWDVYNAAVKAMTAVRDGQAVAITNQGYLDSEVLNSLRDSALDFIDLGEGDRRLGLFEWSAKESADPTDPEALAAANPNLGLQSEYGIDLDNILGEAMRAKRSGGKELSDFRRENMCIPVGMADPAIDPDGWRDAGTDTPIDLAQHRDKLALCLDVAIDSSHATLVAAATIDGTTHIEVVEKWHGPGWSKKCRAEVPALVTKLNPRKFVWDKNGPAASLTASFSERRGVWPPKRLEGQQRTEVEEIQAERPAVCMGLSEQVDSGDIQHPNDPMLNLHVKQTKRKDLGDRWEFDRRGSLPIDASYATAGAVHAARTLKTRTPLVAV